MVEITKDMAQFIRKNKPDVCIKKTMSGHTSRRGKYYAESSNDVLKLIAEYEKTVNVIEEYPVSK